MDTVSKEIRSWNMSRIRAKDTIPEQCVRRLVHAAGFRYRLHAHGLIGRPDLSFPGLRKIIFVHGCFWHRHRCVNGQVVPGTRRRFWKAKLGGNVVRDAAARRQLKREGWRVLVVWECETRVRSLERLQKRLVHFLDS
jgi:DNA mismatch endonuclease (patch repair protein)